MTALRRGGTTLVACFVLSMPFLHALAPFPWLPVPLVVATLIVVAATALLGWRSQAYLLPEDWLLIGCWALGVLALALHIGYLGAKNLTHVLAVFTSFGIFFLGIRNWLLRVGLDWDALGRAAAACAVLLSLAVSGEFVLANTAGLYFSDLVPFNVDEFQATETLLGLKRPRGFAAEPSFTAMVFDLLLPLAWIHLSRRRGAIRVAWVLATLPGLVLLFSAGSIISLGTAIVVVAVARSRRRLRTAFGVGLAGIIFALLYQIDGVSDALDFVVGRKLDDLFVRGDVDVSSHLGRNEAYRAAFALIADEPLGVGWGAISQMFETGIALPGQAVLGGRGLLSLYLEIAACSGLAGLLMFVAFQGVKIAAVWRSDHPASAFLLTAMLALSLHHAFVLEVWFPMLWFTFALADRLRMDEFGAFIFVSLPNGDKLSEHNGGQLNRHSASVDRLTSDR